MPFLGTLVNFLVILLCGIAGTFLKKGVPKRISDAIMSGMAICVVYIGIDGMLEAAPAVAENSFLSAGLFKVMVMILSIAVGTLVGELIDIDKQICRLGDFLEKKFTRADAEQKSVEDGKGSAKGNFARGFVSCSILFCVGAMAVNGSMQDAMGKPDILLAKSVIDGISTVIMSSTLGIGCAFSAFLVLAYQGMLTVLGLFLATALPASLITYMSVTGSLVIILIGTNVLGVTKVKTANMIPAIFAPLVIAPMLSLVF